MDDGTAHELFMWMMVQHMSYLCGRCERKRVVYVNGVSRQEPFIWMILKNKSHISC